MAYKIDFDSPLEDEARRIARELLTDAAGCLEKGGADPHTAIHDARKSIKRTRALYRLIASEAEDFQAVENERLRDIARELSHLRDSAALAETTDYLEQETDEKQAKTAIRRLGRTMKKRRDRIAGAKQEIAETMAATAARLRNAAEAVDHLNVPKLRKQAIDCIATGWRKTSMKARKALAACEDATADEPFHELRKRAQDRYMQAALLTSVWQSGMHSIQRQAKALVDILGREHDLAVLAAQVRDQRDKSPEEREQVLQSIAAEQQKLQQSAREAGRQIFDGKPKRDAEIVALLIRNRS
jgi:CHAD domain-containing protein